MTAKNSAKDSYFAKRLDELECRLAFQDDLIDSLNQVITRQDREITHMASQLKDLFTRISEQLETAAPGTSTKHEDPPHY
ncbi:MAG: SlyX family protein [Proteobacteria bacterium]|nr:SlyX family protein [Pseudomonadota bacterium]MCH8057409.1 SlyX family protein [Pseudomonadota bacterium]